MLTCQKERFSIPETVHYLNCAYMSPQMKSVEAIGHKALALKSQPFRIQVDDFFSTVNGLKQAFAELCGVSEPDRIALIPSVSYGISTVANNISLQAGEKIVLAGEQFPSNYYPWKRLADRSGGIIEMVDAPESDSRAQAWNEAILKAIDDKTRVAALGHVHWTDGTRFDLLAIRERCRAVGALLIIDGTQSVGALPFSIAEIQADALICAGYKFLMGPYSIGLAYFGPYFDEGRPLEENWINRLGSRDFKNLVNYQDAYQPLAGRYSVGEQSNFLLAPMQLTAIRQLLEWRPARIQEYTRRLTAKTIARLLEMGCLVEKESWRCGHLFGVRLNDRFDEQKLKAAFQKRQVHVSLRGAAIRIAPHLYNDSKDLENLVSCFEEARRNTRGVHAMKTTSISGWTK